jgi:hypothetical protein
MSKYGYVHELKPFEECYLVGWLVLGENKDRRVRWDGETHLPEGNCNTQYRLVDIDTGDKISTMSESYTRPKDW